MITFITGLKNSGKSTYLYEWFKKEPIGSGVISIKRYVENIHIGYDLLLLPSCKQIQLCTLLSPTHITQAEDLIQGKFIFEKGIFEKSSQYISENLPQKGKPIWIDEIGLLEVEGKGFMPILKEISSLEYDMRIGVRLSCVYQIARMLHNNHIHIIYATSG